MSNANQSAEDVQIHCDSNVPTLAFSARVKGIMAESLQQRVVIRLLGENLGFNTMVNCIL